MRRIFTFFFILCCLTKGMLHAQQQQPSFKLSNQTSVYLTAATEWTTMPPSGKKEQVMLRMAPGQHLLPSDRNILWQQSLGGSDYLVLLQAKTTTLPAGVDYFVRMQPQWKLDPSLWVMNESNGSVEVLVSIVPSEAGNFAVVLNQYNGRILRTVSKGKNYFEIQVPKNKRYELANWFGLISMSPKANPQTLNYESKVITRAENLAAPLSVGGFALQGEGMVIGVGDNANGLDHVDLRDRIINYNPWPFGSHGIHINGIVGGAGIMDPRARGFAPRATLIDHPYSNVWERTEEMVSSHGMSITNNSYAAVVGNCEFAGTYDGYAALLDSIALAYPEVLHVFASGNDGANTCPPYATGFHTVVGAYQAAKNVLVVGNIRKHMAIEAASSRGPVKDGRLKPEVVAVGVNVFSCKNDDTYQAAGGTSMSCPQVSGLAALLSQRYRQLHGTLPASDLLKAVLMNGASDLGQPGPDFKYGFGLVNGLRSVDMLNNNSYFTGSLTEGASAVHSITVPPGTSKLKVLLYWHDVPASILPAQKLVNDLDLSVSQGGVSYLPFVLDTNAANLDVPATTGVDRLNNVEQVVIESPDAGNYDFTVSGFAVPEGPQAYVLVYLFEDEDLKVTYPHALVAEQTSDSLRIAWEAPTGTNTFTIEFSSDNGSSWNVLNAAVDADARNYAYRLPSLNSKNCKVRVSRNSTLLTFTTASFVVHKVMTVKLSDSTKQCPGSFTWEWTKPGPEVTAFEILQKKGIELVPVDTVSGSQLSYTLTGLWPDSMYYVAVRPFINDAPGRQSKGVRRRPLNGLCTLPVFAGDLSLKEIISPKTGRLQTSTALTATELLKVLVWNYTSLPADNYTIFYQAGTGPVQSTTFNAGGDVIAPVSSKEVVAGSLDLSGVGATEIRAWVVNNAVSDQISDNDSARIIARQLPNDPVTITDPFLEGFEDFDTLVVLRDTMGIGPDTRWDYQHSSDSGRLRSRVNESIPVSGNRAMSMDAYLNYPSAISNLLQATFNLESYAATTFELRAEFDYKLHGIPKEMDSNAVWFRGSDLDPWQFLFSYDTTQPPGTVMHSGSIPLNDILSAAGQNFSASTQFLFGQKDTSLIAENAFGNGVTLDNFSIYRVQKDVAMQRVAQPLPFNCGGNEIQPVSVVVYNTVNQPQHNVAVYYRFNGGPAVMETIPLIPGKDSVTWTFTPTIDLSLPGAYSLDVFLSAAGDTYLPNDSILNYAIRVQPVIATFPYLEDFETGNGNWYAEGTNSSWFWGAPNGNLIQQAASGQKAWMSNTGSGYNSNEQSYLYSPCYDISGLTQPLLSFSQTMEIEDCGATPCDYLQMDYSYDAGATWQKLGLSGEGTNWYNDNVNHVWSWQEGGHWHVSSIPLPPAPPGSLLRLRYALRTDAGANPDGAAIDDIHIFDLKYPILEGEGIATQLLAGDTLVRFLSDNKMVAEVNTAGQNLGESHVSVFQHSDLIAPLMMQYIFPRSFVVRSAMPPADSVTVRLYVLESEAAVFFNATGCVPCTLPNDVYRLGATRYSDPDTSRENGTMTDNEGGIYTYINEQKIRWVPYDKGYYAEFRSNGFSEVWFGDSGIVALPVILVSIDAKNEGNRNRIEWETAMEEDLNKFELEKSADGVSFETLSTVTATGHAYHYTTYDTNPFAGFTYYRLKMLFENGGFLYSNTVRAFMKGHEGFELSVFPNPTDGMVTVRAAGSNSEGVLRLMDVSGRVLQQQSIYYGLTSMDLSSLAKGIYFLSFKDEQHTATIKIEKL